MAMILLLAAPAGAAPGFQDTVLERPGAAGARISASASSARYPINDGSEATIEVNVTSACAETCANADPQQIASFIGTLMHGYEVSLVKVQLDTPFQLGFDCGFGAEACYFSGENKIVISGSEYSEVDGATRDYILAHEYGHHVAQHRENPAPFSDAIDWGPPHWASYEHVCQGRRAGTLFPGDEGTHYYEDPGEAFAEAFARYHFPNTEVRWGWTPLLRPSPGAFEAIREDTLEPWEGRTSFTLSGHFPGKGKGIAVESFRTPVDGLVSLDPARLRGYRMILRNAAGRTLRTSRNGLGPRHRLDYTVCGQSRLRLLIKSTRRSGGTFALRIQRP